MGNNNIQQSFEKIAKEAKEMAEKWVIDKSLSSSSTFSVKKAKDEDTNAILAKCIAIYRTIADNTVKFFGDILRTFNISDDDIDNYFYPSNPQRPENLHISVGYGDTNIENEGYITNILSNQSQVADKDLVDYVVNASAISHASDCIIIKSIVTRIFAGDTTQYVFEYNIPPVISHDLYLALLKKYEISLGDSRCYPRQCEAVCTIPSSEFKKLLEKKYISVFDNDTDKTTGADTK